MAREGNGSATWHGRVVLTFGLRRDAVACGHGEASPQRGAGSPCGAQRGVEAREGSGVRCGETRALYRADGGPRWSTCREWERAVGPVPPCPRGRGEHGELLGGAAQAGEAVDGQGLHWRSAMAACARARPRARRGQLGAGVVSSRRGRGARGKGRARQWARWAATWSPPQEQARWHGYSTAVPWHRHTMPTTGSLP